MRSASLLLAFATLGVVAGCGTQQPRDGEALRESLEASDCPGMIMLFDTVNQDPSGHRLCLGDHVGLANLSNYFLDVSDGLGPHPTWAGRVRSWVSPVFCAGHFDKVVIFGGGGSCHQDFARFDSTNDTTGTCAAVANKVTITDCTP